MVGSDESHFNQCFINCEGQSRKTVYKSQPFWRERRAKAESSGGPSVYQPNALPLGQTGWQSLSTIDTKATHHVQSYYATGPKLLSVAPLSGTTFLLTSDTAVLSHSSRLLLKHFSWFLPTLSYSIPFTGIGCCIWFDLDFAADVFTGWLICCYCCCFVVVVCLLLFVLFLSLIKKIFLWGDRMKYVMHY